MLPYLIYPIIAFALAQGTKVFLKSTRKKRFHWRDVFAYSDMPSGHTATVTALTTIVGLREGLFSSEFALAFVFMAIVITDAIGLRNYLGQHGKTLNVLVKDLKEDDFLDNSYPKQLEHIGHTPIQVIIGGIIGIVVSLIGWSLGL
ncbi:MAG: divergent PAP2 family protein [Patescibacteria group bacterium]|nr:divergent PAP2 family protein [Patescibacteria group bacterium]